MRHGKTFRKRCLTFLLSLAMVLTSVNVPMLTVWAEEETPIENDGSELLTTPTDDGSSDLTAPVEDDETSEDGENPVGGGINPIADDEKPEQPFGLVVSYQKNSDKIQVVWGAPGEDAVAVTRWEIYVDDEATPAATVTECAAVLLENKYTEGNHTVKLYAVNSAGKSEPATDTFTIQGEGSGDTEIKKPSAPLGVVAGYWDTNDDNYKKIKVEWNGVFGDGGTPTSWKVYIDSKLISTETAVAAYFYENTYAAGTHTVKVVAVNDKGESNPTTVQFTLTADQAGGNDVDEGEPVGTGETLVSSEIDLTNLVPATDNSGGTNAGIWSAWTNAGVTAKGAANSTVTFTYPSGKCTTDWALQFQTDESIDIEQGEYYTLTFTAESSIPRQMEVCMGVASTNNRYNDLKYKLPAKQATEIVYVFAADATAKCKIQFLLGAQQDDNSPLWEQEGGHTLKLSNISLVKGKAVAEEGANATVASDSDKTGLKAAIKECEALKSEDYEEESYGVLTTALATAKSVSESAASTKKDVDEALVELQIAQASLHEAGYVPPADPVTMVDPINFEELTMKTYRSQDDGGWGGDSNVQFAFDTTTATISADSFGNPASWAVQWATIAKLESPVDNNVFEFDVVSTTNKSIVFKNENTQATETIELMAGETAHFARRVNGKTFGFTFDLSGGAGKLTFTNMKFGEEVSFYNFKEQKEAGNVELYVGTAEGAVATGDEGEDSYTIQASNAGSGLWSLQLILKNFIDVKTTATYKIGATIESTVDKDITVKLGNPANAQDELALKEISLVANEPQTVVLESELWKEELASTLYFACGSGAAGDITISKVYVVTKKPTAKGAPVLTAGKKNDKKNGYRIGEAVELNYNESAEDWADTITAITVNNKTLTSDKYTLSKEDHKITVNAGVFTKYDVYDFVITAENYQDVKVRVPVYAVSVDNEDWQKEWADEFEGTELDSSKWDYEIGIRSGDDATSDAAIYWGNNEKQYYTKEAVTVQDGKLVVTATALTDELKAKYNITDTYVKYSSGRIRTISEDGSELKFGTTYGRLEAMMELPKATGYWPAFWGLPTPETIDLYGTWAASGELDIMEAVGQDGDYVNGTIHYGSVWPNNVYSGGSHYFEEGDSIEGAHLYAVEWEPGEIRWYVDDILYHVENNWYAKAAGASANYAYPAPFDEDFYLLLNLAISGNYVSNKEPGEDELGKSMKVDYVRVYKDSTKDYGTTPEAPSADKDTEFFEANKVYADDSGNYIKDPEFTTLKDHQMAGGTTVVPGLGYWTTATDAANGASSSISVAERDGVKYGKIDVLKQGANNYDIQLIQHVPLAKGYTYKLTFDAYTDVAAGRTFTIAPKGDADNGWAGYDPGINPNLTAEVRSFEHIFTMNAESDPTARIEMNIGNALGTVYVGNAKLVALTDQEVEDLENEKLHGKKTPLDNGEHVYNGTFDQGNNRLGYWDLDGDYQADTSKRSMRAVINASSNINDATIKQTGLQLLARDTYRLTLNAKADAAKKIKVGLYSAKGVVYAQTQEMVNTDTGEIVLEFTMPEDVTDEEAVLIIAFGGDTISVEIDNVSMVRTTNFNAKWDASILYPLGGETWSDYYYYVYGNASGKSVPADGIVTEAANSSGENYDYMIFRNVSVKTGYFYDLSFDVMTSVANQKVIASVQQDDTWIELAHEEVTTETDWKTVNATFKATTEGAINLKFLLSDSSNQAYNVSLRNVSLKVAGAPYLELKNLPSKLLVGAKFQVNASHTVEVNPDYEVYTYSSSKPDVATISESGLITAVAAGTTTIKVTSGAGATKSFELTVVTEADASVDTASLSEKVTEAESYLSQTDKYSDKSLAELKAAVDAAKAIMDGIASGVIYEQSTIDAAMDDVVKAIEGLQDVTGTDKSELKTSIDKYKNYESTGYTPETWEAFAKALEAAQACLAKANASQEEVDAALKKLENAADALRKADDPTPENHPGLWIRPIPAQTYTGAAIKPEIEVYHDGKLLTIKKDYTVAYKQNTNVGTATVTVTGKGNFKGKDTETFKIEKKDIGAEDISVADVYAIINNKGKVTNPKVTVKYGKKTLKNNNDYKVVWPEDDEIKDDEGNIKAGVYYITITTKDVKKQKGEYVDSANYTGSKKIKYTVRDNDTKLMSKAKVTLEKTKVDYKNSDQGEYGKGTEQPAVTVKMGNDTLTKDVDYVVSYENWDKIGKATVTVTAKDDTKYYGSKSVTYTVNGTKLAAKDLTIEGINTAYDYTGKPIYVSANGDEEGSLKVTSIKDVETPVELTEGKDYEVSYKTGKKLDEHTNVGTVTVTITGINAYTGSINKTFKITAVDLATFVGEDIPAGRKFKAEGKAKYTKTGAKPEITELSFNGTDLVEKLDYTVAYAKNKAVVAGTESATMTIKGKGNFKGQIKHTYEVTKASEADVEVTATDIVKPVKFNKLKPTVKVVETSTGKALKAGTDYEKTITYHKDEACTEASQITAQNFNEWLEGLEDGRAVTVYAKVVMKGNYAGEIPGSKPAGFKLYDNSKKIADAKKYTIAVVTNEGADGKTTIACDKKGNPIYTGAKIEPKVTVTPKGTDTEPLVLDTDYVVSYVNNTNKGKATVTVTGIGNYGGSKSLKFTIVSTDMKWYEKATETIATFFSNLF